MDQPELRHLAYYERVVLDIKQQLVTGVLQVGDKLPSVREFAQEVQLNPNTVAKAYKQLEADGVVEMRPGKGTFIAQSSPVAPQAVQQLHTRFDAVVVEALAAGVTHEALTQWLQAHLQEEQS